MEANGGVISGDILLKHRYLFNDKNQFLSTIL